MLMFYIQFYLYVWPIMLWLKTENRWKLRMDVKTLNNLPWVTFKKEILEFESISLSQKV